MAVPEVNGTVRRVTAAGFREVLLRQGIKWRNGWAVKKVYPSLRSCVIMVKCQRNGKSLSLLKPIYNFEIIHIPARKAGVLFLKIKEGLPNGINSCTTLQVN